MIYQLKLKKVIDNYLFTLSFNENDFNGNIIIGKNIYEDYPREKFFSDYKTEKQRLWVILRSRAFLDFGGIPAIFGLYTLK